MPRQTKRRPKVDELVNADGKHLYRVVVERVLSKVVLVSAESQGAAEDKAYALASGNLSALQWNEEYMRVRDCTSVKLTDGSWRLANKIKKEK